MPPPLKYVDPRRPRGPLYRAYAAFSATRVGRLVSARVMWKIDPYVLRATGGRLGMGLILPTALLETRGAKSSEPRLAVVLYFHDGDGDRDRVIVIASKAGADHHPGWFHNLKADPNVIFGGSPMRATVISDAGERDRLWELADRVFAPYAIYRADAAKAGRTIPIVSLNGS